MGKIKIYIKLLNGALEFRDTEQHEGKTIETSVDPGDKIIWKLEPDSGIAAITGIVVNGASDFFSKGPRPQKATKWMAKVSEKASGEISYSVQYEAKETKVMTMTKDGNNPPPKIIIKA